MNKLLSLKEKRAHLLDEDARLRKRQDSDCRQMLEEQMEIRARIYALELEIEQEESKNDLMDMLPKKYMIDPRDRDFGTICVCAVRYALGRMTYIPSLVHDFLKPHLKHMDDNTLFVMKRDIEEQGGESHDPKAYGMECDYLVWMRFLMEIIAEMEDRVANGKAD